MMESFFHWYDSVIQSPLFQRMGWVDWVSLFFVLTGMIHGLKEGLMRVAGEIAEILILFIVVFALQPKVVAMITPSVEGMAPWAVELICFILIGFAAAFVIGLIDKLVRSWFHTELMAPLRLTGGALLGVVYFLLFWSFLSQAILFPPYRQVRLAYDPAVSISGPFIKNLAPQVHQVTVSIAKSVRASVEGATGKMTEA